MVLTISLILSFACAGFGQIMKDLGEPIHSRPGWTLRPTIGQATFIFLTWWMRPFVGSRLSTFKTIGWGVFTVASTMITQTVVYGAALEVSTNLVDSLYLQIPLAILFLAIVQFFVMPIAIFVIVGLIGPIFYLMLEYCDRLLRSTWLQWLLYPTAVVTLIFIAELPVTLAALALGIEQPHLNPTFKLIGSGIYSVALLWGVIHLAPKYGRKLGVLTFSLLTIYVIVASIAEIQGKTILGDDLPWGLAQLWLLQNVIWFFSALAALSYFLSADRRKHDKGIHPLQAQKA